MFIVCLGCAPAVKTDEHLKLQSLVCVLKITAINRCNAIGSVLYCETLSLQG